MLGRRADKPGGGVAKQGKIIAFDHVGHTETTVPSSRLFAPSKLFLATSDDDEVAVPELADAFMSPTSILQATGSPTSSPAASHVLGGGAVPFSRGGRRGKSPRPWDATLGLAGALNGEPTAAATATTQLTGHSLRGRPVHTINAPSCSLSPAAASKEFGVNSSRNPNEPLRQHLARRCLSPGEMEASEDYTHVIARGPNPRTVHIFDDHVGVDGGGLSAGGGEGEFLRWCRGCCKDLGQGKDIFMYRGEMAFCSHECRYREMLFDEKL